MQEDQISYNCDGVRLNSYALYEPSEIRRPGIIVAHAWKGLDHFAKEKAKLIADMGYIGFAADVYGNEEPIVSDDEAGSYMMPLFIDRKRLQERIKAAYRIFSKHPYVDENRIGAIGFCFGGLTVLELLRSGANVRGVVSFHGVLGNTLKDNHAITTPIHPKIKASALILHGHDDPLVSQQDIEHLENEYTKAGIDWQLHIYGHTSHAFTNPEAHNKKEGLMYQPKSSQRAWQSMWNFFQDLLS